MNREAGIKRRTKTAQVTENTFEIAGSTVRGIIRKHFKLPKDAPLRFVFKQKFENDEIVMDPDDAYLVAVRGDYTTRVECPPVESEMPPAEEDDDA